MNGVGADHAAGLAVSDQGDSRPLLEVDNLHVEFPTASDPIRAIRGLSYELKAGETLAIAGESGSGKSVSALAVMGLVGKAGGQVTRGRIVFDGRDLLSQSSSYVRKLRGERIAMVFQDPLSSLNPVFTVGSQVAEMYRRRRGMSRSAARSAALEMMERVEIPAAAKRFDSYPHEFSGGMRQRVMIAMALALEPDLLIADEPTTALDVTVQAQIMELLSRLTDEFRMSLLLITHDLGVVADKADRVLVMYAGAAAETGPTREVYDHPSHPYTAGLLSCIPEIDNVQERLVPIEGSPPNPRNLPSGCKFHPRCRFSREKCRHSEPDLLTVESRSSDHSAACFFSEEVLRYDHSK